MSKYKPLDAPITRREACTILDQKRFDSAVRSGRLAPLGKRGEEGEVNDSDDAPVTAPLLFDQAAVRELAKTAADDLANEARDYRAAAKATAKQEPPITRRQVAKAIGSKLTGSLIRSGQLKPDGKLTDTQTAAHTYAPEDVAAVINSLADLGYAESALLKKSAKVRIHA